MVFGTSKQSTASPTAKTPKSKEMQNVLGFVEKYELLQGPQRSGRNAKHNVPDTAAASPTSSALLHRSVRR
jgi:hypothetical protein